jgi:acyl-CoA reductase-like NAD-dependent aldehyde dehydrogenase
VDDAVKKANATLYGLAAGVVTNNINTAMTVANNVRGGSIWVNCWDPCSPQAPFGGFQQSGFGKELGQDALKEYYQVKTVVIKTDQKNS